MLGRPPRVAEKAAEMGVSLEDGPEGTADHGRGHVLRAIYEGVVFSHRYHLDRLLRFRERPATLRLTGGAARFEVTPRPERLFEVEAGDAAKAGTFELSRGLHVAGTVVDGSEAPVGGAGVRVDAGGGFMGMMAGPGVIDGIEIDRDSGALRYHTIDDDPPRGICGSGLIDLAAHLFLSGMIDIQGKLIADRCGDKWRLIDGIPHFTIVSAKEAAGGRALTIGQPELDSLIRSKAAMYTILETITDSVGMQQKDLDTFFVAGTFGAYIDPVSAITIGMIPDLPLERYRSIGNSSLGGASRVLAEPGCFDRLHSIRDSITYMELNVNQDFMNRFSAAKFLPHTDTARFPSVAVPANGNRPE